MSNPIASPRLIDSKQIYTRKCVEDYPDHKKNSENIIRLQNKYNKTARDRYYFDADIKS
jgi:hypothetical protein